MREICFIIPARNIDTLHRTLSMLSFQQDPSYRVLVADLSGTAEAHAVAAGFEHQMAVETVDLEDTGLPFWKQCLDAVPGAEWVCFLTPDVDLGKLSVKRMVRCIDAHPSYDIFHWNLEKPYRKYPLKTRPGKLFVRLFQDGDVAPLSSFVIRAQVLREAFEADPEAAGMDLAVILSAAKKTGIRSVRWERVTYNAPVPDGDPALVEKDVRARLAFFRWSERFFGEDDYPLETGDRLALYAGELARLYPSFTYEELKADLGTFAVVSGPIRKMRAASALKAALKARQESLK